ncbi:hypothetical protein F6J84_11385 [Microbacterium caowuchunii]|uniref:DUF6541 family protein n=1 Tax=Microbacterium caowuchunii TaxID=2614638 RepID=UPI00124871B1|nr:DUF6541 family protein [Microbacterium caowuchunii]QEW00639.1 hypothetical protein F6J84_11385 [Microbacterium caowuchunii]
MTWLDLGVAIAATAAIILIPGLGLAALLGLRGLWAWGMAAPFGLTVVVLASLVAPMLALPWGLLPVVAVFVVIGGGIAASRALTGGFRRRPLHRSAGRDWPTIAALILAAGILMVQLGQVIQAPGNISQTFDNIFHLNGIRYALDTANASPLHLGSMTSESGGVWFYPSAWHAVASLVVQITGVDIAVASNGLVFFSACLLWPAGTVLLTRTLFGSGTALMLSAGVFAAALPAMPLLPLDYGVLYPFALGLSVVPAALAAVLALLRIGVVSVPRGVTWIWVIAVLGSLPALAIAHPGAFMAWLVLASIAVLIGFVMYLRSAPRKRPLILASGGFLAYVGAALLAWRVLKPPVDARTWPPTLTLGQGVGEAMTLSYWGGAIPVIAVAALVAGLVVCVRRRTTADVWAITAFASTSLLYIAAVSLPWPTLRDLLTASWYNNAPRLAAIVPIVVVPLAALGAAAVWSRVRVRIDRAVKAGDARGRVRRSIGVGLLVLLVAGTQMGAVAQAVEKAAAGYALTADSALVSEDEMALLRRLPDEVPEDAVIAGSPWTGAGLAYALSGRQVLMPHTLMDIDEETALINDRLDEATTAPEVCTAVQVKDVEYVLDFGSREVHGAEHPYPGFDDLAASGAVEVVDSEGAAVLYRVIACGADR